MIRPATAADFATAAPSIRDRAEKFLNAGIKMLLNEETGVFSIFRGNDSRPILARREGFFWVSLAEVLTPNRR